MSATGTFPHVSQTNITRITPCRMQHCTAVAGGLEAAPSEVNWSFLRDLGGNEIKYIHVCFMRSILLHATAHQYCITSTLHIIQSFHNILQNASHSWYTQQYRLTAMHSHSSNILHWATAYQYNLHLIGHDWDFQTRVGDLNTSSISQRHIAEFSLLLYKSTYCNYK